MGETRGGLDMLFTRFICLLMLSTRFVCLPSL